jgi:hypothetical protein
MNRWADIGSLWTARINHTIKNTDIVINPSAPVVCSAESGLDETDNVESDSA